MTRKALLERLNSFEDNHAVEQWMIDGIHVWPLVKIDLFFRLVAFENKDGVIKKTPQKKNKVKKSVAALFSLGLYLWLIFKSSLWPKLQTSTIVFSDSKAYRFWHKGKFINRYFQPIFEWLKEENPRIKYVIFSDDINFKYYPSKEPIVFIQKYLKGAILIDVFVNMLKKKGTNVTLPDYNEFIKEFTDNELRLPTNKEFLGIIAKNVRLIKIQGKIISAFLKKTNIIAGFELCYYSITRYSLNWEGHKQGFPVYEIQHGGIGPEHVAYSNWLKVPAKGYNLMPEYFWCWDNPTKELLESWIHKQNFHKVFIGGNPWIEYALRNADDKKYSFNLDKKIILYTLQYSVIEDYILEAISKSPKEYEWWLRLHPRKKEAKKPIMEQLYKWRIADKVVIEEATQYPLPLLIMKSAIHLSGSSGSIIEAAQLGLKSLVLDIIGVSYYKAYIDSGVAIEVTTQNASDLLDQIDLHIKRETNIKPFERLPENYKLRLKDILENARTQ